MGLIRLGICLALDSAFTIASAGLWIPMASCEIGGCFTFQELHFQREKEALKEVLEVMKKEKHNGTK